jgi:hypothetical protein
MRILIIDISYIEDVTWILKSIPILMSAIVFLV